MSNLKTAMKPLSQKNKTCGLFKKILTINRQYGFYPPPNLNKHTALKERIKKNEGFRLKPYKDQLGFKTIGYGHLIKKKKKHFYNKKKISKKCLLEVFNLDFNKAVNDYNKLYQSKNFSKNTKETLIEMLFQLGLKKQKKFIKMNKYISKKLFFMAALEMKKSLWYKQTPKRVEGLIQVLLGKEHEKKR